MNKIEKLSKEVIDLFNQYNEIFDRLSAINKELFGEDSRYFINFFAEHELAIIDEEDNSNEVIFINTPEDIANFVKGIKKDE